jgi:BON domain
MKARASVCLSVLLVALVAAIGCNKAPNDSQISSDIQNKMNADSGLQGKQLGVQSADGTVTLSGTVDNDGQREAAARYASSEPGVKQVINNLQVNAPQPPPPAETAQSTPSPEAPKPAPSRVRHRKRSPESSSEKQGSDNSSNSMAATAPPPPINVAPSAPPPPAPPKKLTIPSGTTMAVRLVDTIDSETSQPGQSFHATLDSPLAVEGETAVPAGYDVEGHIVDVKSAGKFQGQSLVALQLDRVKVGDKYYNIQTDQYRRQGSSRGKNTAEKVGAGAGIGAIIGAIAGGGKGAAIGAAAGGGLGGGVQAATKGQQIKLPSETVLNFTLQAPVTVAATNKGPNSGRPTLDESHDSDQGPNQ